MTALVLSPDGAWIASGSADSTIILWDARSRAFIHEWLAHGGASITSLTFSPDSHKIASAGDDNGPVIMWECSPQQRCIAEFMGHTHKINACVWSPDGARIAAVSETKIVYVWDVQTRGRPLYLSGARFLSFSSDASLLATGLGTSHCRVWEVATRAPRSTLTVPGEAIHFATFVPQHSRLIATITRNHTITLWDADTGDALARLDGRISWAHSIAFSPDTTRLITGRSSGTVVTMWDPSSGRVVLELTGHTSWITASCFSHDGSLIASASNDQTVRVWRSTDGHCVAIWNHLDSRVAHIAFGPDVETLWAATENGLVIPIRVHDHLL